MLGEGKFDRSTRCKKKDTFDAKCINRRFIELVRKNVASAIDSQTRLKIGKCSRNGEARLYYKGVKTWFLAPPHV